MRTFVGKLLHVAINLNEIYSPYSLNFVYKDLADVVYWGNESLKWIIIEHMVSTMSIPELSMSQCLFKV